MFQRVAMFLLPALLALPACATEGAAGEGGPATPATEGVDGTSAELKGPGGPLFDDAAFPMSAADFRKKLDERQAKFEAFAKQHRGDAKGPEDAAQRAKLEEHRAERKAKIDAKIAEITADGTVTLDEAKDLRGAFFGGHGPGHHAGGPDGRPHGPPGDRELAELQFPIAADVFRQKVDARRNEMKARFEEHADKIPADKVASIRARIAETNTKVDAKLAEITKDGTVTKEEAESLRDVAFEGFKRERPQR